MLNTAWRPFSFATSSMIGRASSGTPPAARSAGPASPPARCCCANWMSRCSLSMSFRAARARRRSARAPPVSRLVVQRLELLVLVVDLRQLLVGQRPRASSTPPCRRPTCPRSCSMSMNAILASCGNGTGGCRLRRGRLGRGGRRPGGVCGCGAPAGGVVWANAGTRPAPQSERSRNESKTSAILSIVNTEPLELKPSTD